MVSSTHLILKGEPKSTSHIYKMTCRGRFASMYMSKAGKDLKSSYIKQIGEQYTAKTLTNPLKMTLVIFFGTKRKSDWDNFNKLVCDALTGLVYEDDSQIMDGRVIKNYDKVNPRIEVEIQNLHA